MQTEVSIRVQSTADIVTARQHGREIAARLGFSASDLTIIATAISEIARNIVEYAREGEVSISLAEDGSRTGVQIVARDDGPGIADLPAVLRGGITTGSGLGLGLPGTGRLMDEFDIASQLGKGTTVVMRKWML